MSAHATTIRARQRWLHLPLREIADYRDLLFLLVRRDFVAKYKQTLLGPLWFVIQPLLTTLIFTIIFGKVAKIPTDGLPPVLFYLCGLLGWNYFAQTFNTTSTTFVTNAPLFGKVYFPRLVVPLSVALSNLIALGLNLGIFLGFIGYHWIFAGGGAPLQLGWGLAVLPLLILQLAATALGAGLWIAATNGEIPRPYPPQRLHGAAADVCDPGDLPAVPDPRPLAMVGVPQSDGDDRGELPPAISRAGNRLARTNTTLNRHHNGRPIYWGAAVPEDGEDIYRHRVTMATPIIQARGISKSYQLGDIGAATLGDVASRCWHRLRRRCCPAGDLRGPHGYQFRCRTG